MCLWHLQKRFPIPPSLGKEIQMMIQLRFSIFPAQLDKMRDGKGGLLHRGDSFVCTKDRYICSIHLFGGNCPTKQYPDPISAVASKEKASLSAILFITLLSEKIIAKVNGPFYITLVEIKRNY